MDDISTKAIIIGVSIFVTLIIVTLIIFEFTEISTIYRTIGETNITFEEQIDEFNKFKDENNEFNGLDIINLLGKYKKDDTVRICIGEVEPICDDEINISKDNYNDNYSPRFIEEKGIYLIKFIEK